MATSRAAKSRETARWGMRCWIAVPMTTPSDGRDREQEAGEDVDVAVDAALGDRAEQADQDDRRQAGAGGEPLAVAEPEDQQGHDDGAAADAEEAAEDAGQGADRGELEGRVARRHLGRGHRAAILRPCLPKPRQGTAAPGTRRWSRCAPTRAARRSSPTSTAPWRRSSSGPSRPRCRPRASELLRALSERYGLVGCISGRQALEARRLVGVEEIAYAGNHGLELLLPGEEEPQLDPALAGPSGSRRSSSPGSTRDELAAVGLRLEDKGPIQALHWRGAEDERAAEARAHEIAAEAGRAELEPRWGRKVLELRPVGGGGKDAAVAALLAADGDHRRGLRRRRPHRPRRLPPPARAARGRRAGERRSASA